MMTFRLRFKKHLKFPLVQFDKPKNQLNHFPGVQSLEKKIKNSKVKPIIG